MATDQASDGRGEESFLAALRRWLLRWWRREPSSIEETVEVPGLPQQPPREPVGQVFTHEGHPEIAVVDLGRDISDALRVSWDAGHPFESGGVIQSVWLQPLFSTGTTAASSLLAGNVFLATADPSTLITIGAGKGSAVIGVGGKIINHAPFVSASSALLPVVAPLMLFTTVSSLVTGARLDRIIVPPMSLDSSLAIHPGSKRKEAVDVSEYGRAGRRGPLGEAGRPPQAVERASEGRGGVAAAAGGGRRRSEPGDSGCAAGAGAVAAGVPGRRPAGPQEEEPAGRRADADPGEAGGADDAGRVAGGVSRKKGVRGRAEEALEALGRVSPATNQPYPLTMVCETWRVARSSVYELRARRGERPESDRRQPGKRGPKTALSDEELLQEIRTVLKASPFLGEGHRKVKARLAAKGIRAGKNRVLRLMRERGLLAPVRRGRPRGDRSHSGRIRTERPDELWGTDASRFWTKAEGWCWFFATVDHCASDVVGWHVAKKGDRWAALEPVRQGVRAHMGGFGKAIALGPRSAARLGLAVQGQAVPGRDQVARHPLHARLCGRTGVQRRRGALHPDLQGGVHLSAPLRNPRGGQSGDRGLHQALQQRLAPPAARVHDPGPRPREAQPESGLMFKPSTCPENRVRYTCSVLESTLTTCPKNRDHLQLPTPPRFCYSASSPT